MVEIGLEPLDAEQLPKDLYLSLRVGEQQKFSRASAAKAYKFAQSTVGERRFAKVEMYKRVGVCSVPIDPEKVQGTHEITVPMNEGTDEVRYRISLDPSSGEGKPANAQPPAKDMTAKVSAAREYLDKHQLEHRLAEAMQAVLRERPEDPGAFLAQRLCSGAGVMRKVSDARAKTAPEPAQPAGQPDGQPDHFPPPESAPPAPDLDRPALPEALGAAEPCKAAAPAAPEAAAAPVLASPPATEPFKPAVPVPTADAITPMTLVVSGGHIGFSTMMGLGMTVL